MVNKVLIELKGEAIARWAVGKTHYKSHIIYLDHQRICAAKSGQQQHLCLESGAMKTYWFEFRLPFSLPTSFEQRLISNGHIRYWLQGVVDIPWSFNRYTHTTFTVVNGYKLAAIPLLRNPVSVSDRKLFCCGPCQSNPVEISFTINKTGFVAGEKALFDVWINNETDRRIDSLTIILKEKLTYQCKTQTHTFKEEIKEKKFGNIGIGPKTNRSVSNLAFKIPPICPSLLNSCPIIRNEYTFEMKIGASGWPSLAKYLVIPIQIGTEPLIDPSKPVNYKISYEACSWRKRLMNNDGQIQMKSGINFYCPIYPVYEELNLTTPLVRQDNHEASTRDLVTPALDTNEIVTQDSLNNFIPLTSTS